MQEKAKELLQKVLDWWNRFTSKQKTVIIGIAAVVVFTFAILIYVFTKPQYTVWRTCETTTEASEVRQILEDAEVTYEISSDALVIRVLTSQLGQANLALGAAGYMPDAWGIDNVTSGGFSTTEADKQRRYKVYLENQLSGAIRSLNAVKDAEVILTIPDQNGTLLASKEETSASIKLALRDKFTTDQAATIARAVATALGNTSTANITIWDTDANLLFSGEEEYTLAGITSSMMEFRAQAEQQLSADVQKMLLGTKQFDLVTVTGNLVMDYSSYEEAIHEYSVPDGKDQGYYSHRDELNSSNSGTSGGVPGTDSNDESGYLWQTGENSESSQSETSTDYLVNEYMKKISTTPGVIKYNESGVSVSAIRYRVIKEGDAKKQGLLAGISWAEYKAMNDQAVKMEVDQDMYSAVANATGISVDRITILAYEVPIFADAEGWNVEVTDVLSIVLIIIILALLVLVVLRSMMGKKETVSEEEELSVENLMQSSPEPVVESIEAEEKSETRKLIEKFVDDNPEAAANLLRNWLNEDWG
ncbi:MAG: flagellar M-ring protein FliF [Lachnospiraceae bacterium]|nr:flagellar M-ring protein FliF [Lachnospiraceae bacterium]